MNGDNVLDPAAILILTSVACLLVMMFCISYYTGVVFGSIWSIGRKNEPKFNIDKTKIGSFALTLLLIFILNLIYGFIVVQGVRAVGVILALSLFNTAVLGFGLSYRLLLKMKK